MGWPGRRSWSLAALLAIAVVALTWAAMHWRHKRPGTPRAANETQNDAMVTSRGPEPLRWQLASLACGRTVHRDSHGEIVCPVCPPESDFAGQPLTPGSDADTSWTVAGLVFGHFTQGQAEEAVLKSRGCESHANGFGGDFLLRRQGSTWQRVRYIQAGQIDDSCQRVRWTEGRDALVCEIGDMHQGLAFAGVELYLIDPSPAEPGEGQDSEFLGLSDDEGACLDAQTPQWSQSASLDGVELLPGLDGRQDVAVRALVGRVKGKADRDGNCPTAPTRPYRLVFRNDGDHFTAVAGAQPLRALQQMDCCRVNVGEAVRPYRY